MSRMIGGAFKIVTAAESEDILVESDAVVYTRAFPMGYANYFGLWAKAVSVTGTPDVKIELEESYALPSTEGEAETDLWVVPDSMDPIFAQINDELAHIATVSPKPMTYGRYKITGINANPADTVVNLMHFQQEQA